jgi:hypothetical protein
MSDTSSIESATGFPSAEWDILQELQSQGVLDSVTPDDLAVIWQAEGSNSSDAVNSEGYGGWFGTTDGTGSFQSQAESAAGTYSAGLTASGGDLVGAEEYYQTGSTTGGGTGSEVFQQYINEGDLPGREDVSATTSTPGGGVATTSGGKAGNTAGGSGKYDFFTEAMIQLDGVMHPKLKASVITSLGVGAIGPDLNMIMARGLFATAFGALGLLVLFKSSSGGKISGAALPALVAGLVAGPEAAALTGMSKLGIRKPAAAGAGAAAGGSPNTVLSQQRLAFQQQTAQQKLQLSAAKNASQAQLGQQRLAQSAAAQTQRTQTAHKKTLAQRYAARQRVAAAQTRALPRTSTIHHQTTRQSTITHYSAKNPAPSDPGDS